MSFFSHFSNDSWSFRLENRALRSRDLISIPFWGGGETLEVTPVPSVQEHRDHPTFLSLSTFPCLCAAFWHGEPDLPVPSVSSLICAVLAHVLCPGWTAFPPRANSPLSRAWLPPGRLHTLLGAARPRLSRPRPHRPAHGGLRSEEEAGGEKG